MAEPSTEPESFAKVNGVLHYLGFSSMNEEFPSGERPGIVHRLDVGTTGVIVVAKTVPWRWKKKYTSVI